jgi:hypothetical protein
VFALLSKYSMVQNLGISALQHSSDQSITPQVDVTKFDGSDPTGWVTQVEHYFSLYNITDDLAKLRYGVLHLDQERWQ